MNNVISLSGGKDSTAMVHAMLDRGEKIHSLVFFDTGWEFPQMHEHVNLVEQKTRIPVIRLKSKKSFDYWMYHQGIIARKGEQKGQMVKIGNGWPSPMRRWCTRQKVDALDKYKRTVTHPISCIGYAADELHRCKPGKRYPLIEFGMTEEDCLHYCKSLGYTWGGLYDIFNRVSCWCCPLQSLADLRKLRKYLPQLWNKLLEMDARQPKHNPGFKDFRSVIDLEKRFCKEDRQLNLFENYSSCLQSLTQPFEVLP